MNEIMFVSFSVCSYYIVLPITSIMIDLHSLLYYLTLTAQNKNIPGIYKEYPARNMGYARNIPNTRGINIAKDIP